MVNLSTFQRNLISISWIRVCLCTPVYWWSSFCLILRFAYIFLKILVDYYVLLKVLDLWCNVLLKTMWVKLSVFAVLDSLYHLLTFSAIVFLKGSCYSVNLRDNHSCIENSMQHHCPICYEVFLQPFPVLSSLRNWIPIFTSSHLHAGSLLQYLFDSLKDVAVMKCGHTMHRECYFEMIIRDK